MMSTGCSPKKAALRRNRRVPFPRCHLHTDELLMTAVTNPVTICLSSPLLPTPDELPTHSFISATSIVPPATPTWPHGMDG